MSNVLNVRLSKLIYALASDDPEYLSKVGTSDRLPLLAREFYRMLDETESLKQLVSRLYYGKHYSLTKPGAVSPDDDADALRLKRWMIYLCIVERTENCGRHLSTVLEDAVLEDGAGKSHYIGEADTTITRFGLTRNEAVSSATEVEEVLKVGAELLTVNKSQNVTSRYNGNLHQIRVQERVENYSTMRKVVSMQISCMRFIFPHVKQFAA